jgi:hypothetical protein
MLTTPTRLLLTPVPAPQSTCALWLCVCMCAHFVRASPRVWQRALSPVSSSTSLAAVCAKSSPGSASPPGSCSQRGRATQRGNATWQRTIATYQRSAQHDAWHPTCALAHAACNSATAGRCGVAGCSTMRPTSIRTSQFGTYWVTNVAAAWRGHHAVRLVYHRTLQGLQGAPSTSLETAAAATHVPEP